MKDVEIMEDVFIGTSLEASLHGMTKKSSKEQISDFNVKEMRRASRQGRRKGKKQETGTLLSLLRGMTERS